jgi:hypothetical protein
MKNVGLGHPQVVTQKWLHSVREICNSGAPSDVARFLANERPHALQEEGCYMLPRPLLVLVVPGGSACGASIPASEIAVILLLWLPYRFTRTAESMRRP